MSDRYSIISQAWTGGETAVLDASCNDDSYATADEGDECCDETEYLSVLESTARSSLGHEDVTLSDSALVVEAEEGEGIPAGVSEDQQQVVIFSVEGSEELFGLQVAQDEDGNVKKYQFQLRTNEDGQLEAMPETIQLVHEETDKEDSTELIKQQNNNQQLPPGISHYSESEVFIESGNDLDGATLNSVDTKVGILENRVQLLQIDMHDGQGDEAQGDNIAVFVKGEPLEQEQADDIFEELVEYTNETEGDLELSPSEVKQEILHQNKSVFQEMFDKGPEMEENGEHIVESTQEFETEDPAVDENELTVLEYQNYPPDEVTICEEDLGHHEETLQHPQTVPGTLGSLFMEAGCSDNIEFVHESESEETETYEAVKSIHVTGDLELHQELVLSPSHVKREILQEMFHKESEMEENGEHIVETTQEFGHPQMVTETLASLFMEAGCSENIEFVHESESEETETYEAVKRIHVTADTVLDEHLSSYNAEESVFQSMDDAEPLNPSNRISGGSLCKISPKKPKPVLYYLMESQEKENVDLLPTKLTSKPPMKTHPRSILKGDLDLRLKPQMVRPPSNQPQRPSLRLNAPSEPSSLGDKRFARSKRAAEERLFHNFINRTTIPHAPVRRTRLPRKQQIRPVDNRRDEEIIVQEVMVSSGGCFVESTELALKDRRVEVQTIELSDSEEEETSGQSNSVIEIVPSDDEAMPDTEDKRTREGSPDNLLAVSPAKRYRSDEASSSDLRKKEFVCPRCPKTFPSENSLSTHIQHHNLESCMRTGKRPQQPSLAHQYNHKCEICGAAFKNRILLARHDCPKSQHKCGMCKKEFEDATGLNAHKKSHVKRRLTKDTINVSICPAKFKSPNRKSLLPRFSTAPRITLSQVSGLRPSIGRNATRSSSARPSLVPSPKKEDSARSSSRLQLHQCRECHKVCSTREILAVHEKSHRKFSCVTCGAAFASRLLLDEHLRLSCVKTSSPKLRRLSFKVRRSAAVAASQCLSTMKSEPIDMQAKCDDCGKTFRTHAAMFRHRVKEHGLHTPDKRFMQEEKKKLFRPPPAHCGIPAPEKLRKIWGRMEEELAKTKPVS